MEWVYILEWEIFRWRHQLHRHYWVGWVLEWQYQWAVCVRPSNSKWNILWIMLMLLRSWLFRCILICVCDVFYWGENSPKVWQKLLKTLKPARFASFSLILSQSRIICKSLETQTYWWAQNSKIATMSQILKPEIFVIIIKCLSGKAQWRRHRVDWGGLVHPGFPRGRFAEIH